MRIFLPFLAILALSGCGDHRMVTREQALPGGGRIRIAAAGLTLGLEHDVRLPDQDGWHLEYVSNQPQAGVAERTREAWSVFALLRPTCELWRMPTASLAGFPTDQRQGPYDVFVFQRKADGSWACERHAAKVFAND